MNTTYNSKNIITYYGEEKYILKSSSTLLIPSLYAYLNGNLILASLNLTSCVVSNIFWYYPIKGLRRNIDIYYQPLFGISMYFLGNMYYKPNNLTTSILGHIFVSTGLYLYYKSCEEYKKYNRFWYIYHTGFHILISSSLLCVHNINKK